MKKVILQNEDVHAGNLVLVNQEYGYLENGAEVLVPVNDMAPSVLMQQEAKAFLARLMEEIKGWQGIVPVSGWRSKKEQQEIWDNSLAENGRDFTQKYVAFPGHSEHQTGLAIDLGLKQEQIDFICPEFPYDGLCGVFRHRAAEYGFIERYPLGKEEITGIGHEPWHFRYVGVPHSLIMEQEKLTLEEYSSFVKKFPYENKKYEFFQDGRKISVSFLEAGKSGTTEFEIEEKVSYFVSGNNADGFVITCFECE